MKRYNVAGITALVLLALIFAGIIISCGKRGTKHSVESPFGETSSIFQGDTDDTAEPQPIERTLAQVIAEIEAYEPPAEVVADPDFDPGVFEMLREEFIRQMEASKLDRLTSAAPLGDAGRVTDLTYDDTERLNWSYVNVGDYDSSGEVGIPDITPIAQNYLAKTNDGIGDDALEAWIDGDKSGEVGISDITPIAQGYLNTVMEYRILTSSQPDSGFTVIGSPIPFGDAGVFPKTFSVILPVGANDYVAVEPVGADLIHGERSNIVSISGLPIIASVEPTSGLESAPIVFSASVSGAEPLTYYWDFGDAATPSTSTEASPLITPGATGIYSCSLQVFNDFGNDSFGFTLYIEEAPQVPSVISVSPLWCIPNEPSTFSAVVHGTPPLTYNWNFGGASIPNNSSEQNPTVMIGAADEYDASLMVTNDLGSDTYNFTLLVGNQQEIPDIAEDTIALYAPVPTVATGEFTYVFVLANVAAAKPLANLDVVRLLVSNSELLCTGFGCMTQSETNFMFSNDFAMSMSGDATSGGDALYAAYVGLDAWAGFGDQDGVALSVSPPLPQSTFVDAGICWSNNAMTAVSGSPAIIAVLKFRGTGSGTASVDIQGNDGTHDKTFYSDLDANTYTFGVIGPAIDIEVS